MPRQRIDNGDQLCTTVRNRSPRPFIATTFHFQGILASKWGRCDASITLLEAQTKHWLSETFILALCYAFTDNLRIIWIH